MFETCVYESENGFRLLMEKSLEDSYSEVSEIVLAEFLVKVLGSVFSHSHTGDYYLFLHEDEDSPALWTIRSADENGNLYKFDR